MSSTEALQPDGDAVLYVIDASDSMRRSGLLAQTLNAVCTSIRLIHRQADQHFDSGVVLYGCENPDFSRSKFHQVQVMMRVSDPRVEDLKKLMAATTSTTPQFDGIGAATYSEYSLLSALQQSKLEMALLKPSILRRLVLVTNNDNPGNLKEVQKIAHELVGMNVLFVPVFLETKEVFDATKFWSHLVYLPPSMSMSLRNTNLTVSLQPCNVDNLDTDFSALILSKAERKPSLFRGTLEVQSMPIGVVGYKICSKAAPRKSHYYANIEGSVTPLISSTSYVTKDTHEEVDPALIERRIVIGARESLPVSEDDASELLAVNSEAHPKLTILNFVTVSKANNVLPSASILIVPSNYALENSKSAFASLRRSLIRKQVVAWAVYTTKTSRKPPVYGYIFAFNPYPKVFTHEKSLNPDTSSGMYFVQQPYEDDLRNGPEVLPPFSATATAAATAAATATATAAAAPPPPGEEPLSVLIQQLLRRFFLETGYDPSLFPNPSYSQFHNVLESLALGTPLPPARDATRPNYKSIATNATDILSQISAVLKKIAPAEEPRETKNKRPIDHEDIYKSAAAGLLDRYSLVELRAIALSLHLSDRGRKPEVVERVKTALLNSKLE